MDRRSWPETWIKEFKNKKERNKKYEELVKNEERFRWNQSSVPDVYYIYKKVFKIIK